MTALQTQATLDRKAARQGAWLLGAVVLGWGLSWPANKLILLSLPVLWMTALRSAIATVAVFAIWALRGRIAAPPRADLPVLLSITLLHMVGFAVFASLGLALVPAGRSVVLAYTVPLWVTPGASLFLKERLTARKALGVAVGLSGVIVLFNPLSFDWANGSAVLGNFYLLLAALLWAASILHIRGHRWRSTPFELLPWEMLLATLILTAVAGAGPALPPVAWRPELILLLLYTGIPGTVLTYWAAAMASRSLPAVTTSLGLLFTPVVGLTVSSLALGEPLTPALLIAVLLILGGVALGTTAGRARLGP